MSNISENKTFPGSNSAKAFIDRPFHSNSTLILRKDVKEWLFDREKPDDTPNMTVLPVLAIIFFIVCVLLKVYKWYKDGVRRKARGDVEFGDESEVNYGIITAGDKEFCHVEIRSDTTSVYDTVNSFRLIGNGHAVGGSHNYHDTVTSYKSILMQRLDGAQYDSVKSYKAFLKQVTQNTDLAVEVKLLENYPVRSKSAEHCVLEEESSGLSEAVKPLTLPIPDVQIPPDCNKKKTRHRRASGDALGAMRKRSASNPTYHSSRTGAGSLPSIISQTLSSDSSNEDEAFVSLASDRRKLWEIRKKMARSCSGGKLAKASPSKDEEETSATPHLMTRRRHYSADSARRPRKPLGSVWHRELKDLRESISETDPKPEEAQLLRRHDDSSSENPDSSPTSCSSSISSDAIESESEEDDTQQITQLSVASDDYTVSCDGVFDSCGELASSAEHLLGPVKGDSVIGLCNLPIDTKVENDEKVIPAASAEDSSSTNVTCISKLKTNGKSNGEISRDHSNAAVAASANQNNGKYSSPLVRGEDGIIPTNTQHLSSSPSSTPANVVEPREHPSPQKASPSSPLIETANEDKNAGSPDMANPRRIQRFHVTFVSSDVSSPNSD